MLEGLFGLGACLLMLWFIYSREQQLEEWRAFRVVAYEILFTNGRPAAPVAPIAIATELRAILYEKDRELERLRAALASFQMLENFKS